MELDELRKRIDSIDDTLLDLYNERMEHVHEIGRVKNRSGAPIYRPEREKEILSRLKKRNKERGGLLSDNAIEALFMELFAVARNFELPERVAYLGPEASFTANFSVSCTRLSSFTVLFMSPQFSAVWTSNRSPKRAISKLRFKPTIRGKK